MPRTYKKKEWVKKYLVKKALIECRKYTRCIEKELLYHERKLKKRLRLAVWRTNNYQHIKNRINKWVIDNKEQLSLKRKIYAQKNKDHIALKNKKRYIAKYELLKQQRKEYREQNRSKIRKQALEKYHELKHTEKYVAQMRANSMKRYTSKKKRCPTWLSSDGLWIIKEAYALANLRKKLFKKAWHVDHVIPLQGETVSGLHVPSNIQVVPAKWNLSKSNKHTKNFWGLNNETLL
jgi:hypothetical protein